MTYPPNGQSAVKPQTGERLTEIAREVITRHEGPQDWDNLSPAWAKLKAEHTHPGQATSALERHNRLSERCDALADPLSDEQRHEFAAVLSSLRAQRRRARELMWAWQVIAGGPVTAKSPRALEAESRRCGALVAHLRRMPDDARFRGRTLGDIRLALGRTRAPRRVAACSARPAPSASRTGSSSSTSGSDPGDGDPHQDDEPEAPTAAREAVAAVWESILRARTPAVSWEVQR